MDKTKLIAVPVLLFLSCVFLLLMWFVSYGLLAEYGTDSGSLAEGSGDGFTAGIWFGVAAAGFAVAAIRVAGGNWIVWSSAVVVVVAGVGGPFVGGALAAKQRSADLPDGPYCYHPGHAPALRAVLQPVERAFRELDHPGKFSGGGGNGYTGCDDGLLHIDMTAAEAHYRRVLPRHGWKVREGSERPLVAKRGDLRFRLFQRDGMPTVHIGPAKPRLP